MIEGLLREAVEDGVISCRKCGSLIEPDGERCGECGWINPLVEGGFI